MSDREKTADVWNVFKFARHLLVKQFEPKGIGSLYESYMTTLATEFSVKHRLPRDAAFRCAKEAMELLFGSSDVENIPQFTSLQDKKGGPCVLIDPDLTEYLNSSTLDIVPEKKLSA